MPYSRRWFIQLSTGAIAGFPLWGCSRDAAPTVTESSNSRTTVFINGTVLPVDAAFSEHSAIAIRNEDGSPNGVLYGQSERRPQPWA